MVMVLEENYETDSQAQQYILFYLFNVLLF
jgi:hypothetical protein